MSLPFNPLWDDGAFDVATSLVGVGLQKVSGSRRAKPDEQQLNDWRKNEDGYRAAK